MHFIAIVMILYLIIRYLDGVQQARKRRDAARAHLMDAIAAQQARTEERLDDLDAWRKLHENEHETDS